MKARRVSRWVDIYVRAKTNAPLKLVRNLYKLNREFSDVENLNYYDIEVSRATVKMGKEAKCSLN